MSFEKTYTYTKKIACSGLSLVLAAGLGFSLSAVDGRGQAGARQTPISAAEPLVRGLVDDTQRVSLRGNVHPLAQARFDQGKVEDEFAVSHIHLFLNRSAEQQKALQQFLQEAHTPGAAGYHQWLTPEEFGKRFGAADSDVAAVTAWLEGHGFAVEKVHPGRIAVQFSGNAAQVREAFGTEIHRYVRQGKTYYANATEPQIPAALAGVVRGVSPLHSMHAQPSIKVAGATSYNVKTHEATPAWTAPGAGSGAYLFELSPSDFAVQYDLGPLYTAGTTGTGVGIGILSTSNIDLSLVQAYQTLFGLPANLPTVVIDGDDPGQNDASSEAYLDVEIAGSVAPGAKTYLYTAQGTVLSEGLYSAGLRAVEDNQVSVLSLSYVTCESALGAAGNAGWSLLWEEAAAQGISAFVAAGDGGSAGCDNYGGTGIASHGLAVNGLGSTPFNIAVGGTDFYFSNYGSTATVMDAQIATYWKTTTTNSPATSLLQAAPEQVWNNAFGLNARDGGKASSGTIYAGSGGVSSSAIYPPTGAATGYPKPAWQAGTGVPADGHRDVPDVSLFAANGMNYVYYPICAIPGDCVPVGGIVTLQSAGGTSASSPAMAGIQALVDQSTGSRQGNANVVYYALAAKTTAKAFRDVTVGGNEVPCTAGTANCVLWSSGPAKGFYGENGYLATTGYDRATGLGTVDAANLVKNWSTVSFRPTATTLSISPASFTHGTATTVKATTAVKSGTGTPTGNVGLVGNDAVAFANELGTLTLSGGAVSASLTNLPGGTYQVVAEYTGDTTFGASVSAPVTVTVAKENDTLVTYGWMRTPADGLLHTLTAGMSVPYGSELYLDAQPEGVNEKAIVLGQFSPPSGSVVYTDKVGTSTISGTIPLDSQGIAEWIPASLAVGTHAIGVTYAGDVSYNASSAPAAASFTVTKGTTTLTVKPLTTSVDAGGTLTVDVGMSPSYLPLTGAMPTGNVTVTLGTQTVTVPWRSWNASGSTTEEAVATFTKVPAGTPALSASYAGDGNWAASSKAYGSITSAAKLTAPVVTLTATTTTYAPTAQVTVVGTVTGVTGKAAPTGNLTFSWEGGKVSYVEALKAASATSSSFTLTFPAYQLANGSNLLVATYAGDSNFAPQASSALVITLNGGDFSLTATTELVGVKAGGSGAGSVTITPFNGFSGTITAACASATGITCTPAAATGTLSSAVADTITIKPASTVAKGTYPAVVTVSGGGRTHTAQILVTVQ